jgi:uncharacterized protein DUF6178
MLKRKRRRRGKPGPKPMRSAVPVDTPVTAKREPIEDRLARLLDTPHLAQIVPRVPPEVLHDLIRERGIEACAGLIAASTPQQLAAVLDLDLWQTSPTRDDQFDEWRFGTWLETLMNEGEMVAISVLAAMDPDLAVTGLSRYVRVFDPGIFEPTAQSDDESPDLDVARSTALECEIGGYVVRARTSHAWDAIVGLFATVAAERPDVFNALMQGCRRVSNSTPERDGLDDLMLEPEQLLHDVSIEREQRRTQQGYLAAAEARAFLQMGRQRRSSKPEGPSSINAIAAAYFRALDTEIAASAESLRHNEQREPSTVGTNVSKSVDAIVQLSSGSGFTSAHPRALLGAANGEPQRLLLVDPLLEYVHDRDEMAYFARHRELAFLANALVAGCSVYSRPLTIKEAWNAARGACNLGLEVFSGCRVDGKRLSDAATTLPDDLLVNHDLLSAFEAGWKLLHDHVSMFVTRCLIDTLQELQHLDSPVQHDLYRLRRKLERDHDSAMPWLSQDALEPLSILDMPAWASLCGLLSECPVLPATMNAILDRHAGAVSATAFDCFSTREQIRRVHEFAGRLRQLLFSTL